MIERKHKNKLLTCLMAIGLLSLSLFLLFSVTPKQASADANIDVGASLLDDYEEVVLNGEIKYAYPLNVGDNVYGKTIILALTTNATWTNMITLSNGAILHMEVCDPVIVGEINDNRYLPNVNIYTTPGYDGLQDIWAYLTFTIDEENFASFPEYPTTEDITLIDAITFSDNDTMPAPPVRYLSDVIIGEEKEKEDLPEGLREIQTGDEICGSTIYFADSSNCCGPNAGYITLSTYTLYFDPYDEGANLFAFISELDGNIYYVWWIGLEPQISMNCACGDVCTLKGIYIPDDGLIKAEIAGSSDEVTLDLSGGVVFGKSEGKNDIYIAIDETPDENPDETHGETPDETPDETPGETPNDDVKDDASKDDNNANDSADESFKEWLQDSRNKEYVLIGFSIFLAMFIFIVALLIKKKR